MRLRILSACSCALLVVILNGCRDKNDSSSHVPSQPAKKDATTRKAETQPTSQRSLSDLLGDISKASRKANVFARFLFSSVNRQLEAAETLKTQRESFENKWASLAADSNRPLMAQILEEYLAARIEKMKELQEDIDFIVSKFDEEGVPIVNTLPALNQKIQEKILLEVAVADWHKEKTKFLATSQQIALRVQSYLEQPAEPGTTQYIEWFRGKQELRRDWRRLFGRVLRRNRKISLHLKLSDLVGKTFSYYKDWFIEAAIFFEELKADISVEIKLVSEFKNSTSSSPMWTLDELSRPIEDRIAEKMRQVMQLRRPFTPLPIPAPRFLELLTLEELAAGEGTKRIRELVDKCDKAIDALKNRSRNSVFQENNGR